MCITLRATGNPFLSPLSGHHVYNSQSNQQPFSLTIIRLLCVQLKEQSVTLFLLQLSGHHVYNSKSNWHPLFSHNYQAIMCITLWAIGNHFLSQLLGYHVQLREQLANIYFQQYQANMSTTLRANQSTVICQFWVHYVQFPLCWAPTNNHYNYFSKTQNIAIIIRKHLLSFVFNGFNNISVTIYTGGWLS